MINQSYKRSFIIPDDGGGGDGNDAFEYGCTVQYYCTIYSSNA